MIVRLASEDDLPALLAIEERCFGSERFSQETVFAFLLRDDAFVVVAEEGGELMGSAMCLVSEAHREGRITSLAVPKSFRRRGIGTMLLGQCEKVFESLGLLIYSLEVETINEPATSMYLANGYEIVGLVQDFYGLGRPAYSMAKRPVQKNE